MVILDGMTVTDTKRLTDGHFGWNDSHRHINGHDLQTTTDGQTVGQGD